MPPLKMHQHWAGRWVIVTHEANCAEELAFRLSQQTPLQRLVYSLQQLQEIKANLSDLPAIYGTSALEWCLLEEIQKLAQFAGNPDHCRIHGGELRILDVDGRTLYVHETK